MVTQNTSDPDDPNYIGEGQDTVDTLQRNDEENVLRFFEDALDRAEKLQNQEVKEEIFEKLETIITVIHHE